MNKATNGGAREKKGRGEREGGCLITAVTEGQGGTTVDESTSYRSQSGVSEWNSEFCEFWVNPGEFRNSGYATLIFSCPHPVSSPVFLAPGADPPPAPGAPRSPRLPKAVPSARGAIRSPPPPRASASRAPCGVPHNPCHFGPRFEDNALLRGLNRFPAPTK